MLHRRLIFLGGEEAEGVLSLEGQPLSVGQRIDLVRKRSPWGKKGDLVRVIVGSHPSRADVLLTGKGLLAEHARVYFHAALPGSTDFRPLHPELARLNGRTVEALEWLRLLGGEEVTLGSWRFRFEEIDE